MANMRKKKCLKSITSVVLAVTMLFSQVIPTGADDLVLDQYEESSAEIMQEDVSDSVDGDLQEVLVRETQTSSEQTEENNTSDGIILENIEEVSDPKVATETGAAVNDEADSAGEHADALDDADAEKNLAGIDASLLAVSEESNTWIVNATWTVKNGNGQKVRIALSLDAQTFQALPEEYQPDKDGICHFVLKDGTVLPLVYSDKENDGRIYLISEENKDGSYQLEFVLKKTDVRANQDSTIDLVVFDVDTQSWSVAARENLEWRTLQDDAAAEETGAATAETKGETVETQETAAVSETEVKETETAETETAVSQTTETEVKDTEAAEAETEAVSQTTETEVRNTEAVETETEAVSQTTETEVRNTEAAETETTAVSETATAEEEIAGATEAVSETSAVEDEINEAVETEAETEAAWESAETETEITETQETETKNSENSETSETETEAEHVEETESETEGKMPETETEAESETGMGTDIESEAVSEAESEQSSEKDVNEEAASDVSSLTEEEALVTAHKESTASPRMRRAAMRLSSEETGAESGQGQDDKSVDLSGYLTNANATVDQESNAFLVKLDYKINTSVLQQAGTNIVTYKIPENIFTKKEYQGSVLDGSTVVGTYLITSDGIATIVFDESYVKGTPADITGSVSFWARTSEDKVDEEGKLEIVFNEQYSTTITLDRDKFYTYDSSLDKKCTSTVVDKEAKKVIFTYQIEINTENGTGAVLTFEDLLQSQADKAEYKELVIEKYDSNNQKVNGFANGTVAIVPGTSSTDPKLEGTLPSLNAHEKYVITYKVERALGEDESSVYVKNEAKVSNKFTSDTDYSEGSASLYDLAVDKKSSEPPVLDKANGTLTNSYQIKISTEKGTKGEINLTDTVVYWPAEVAENYRHEYKVTSVKKHFPDGTEQVLPLNDLYVDNQDQLAGTLPELGAGEYYTIEYTNVITGLPEDGVTQFELKNKLFVKDDVNQKDAWDSDQINWVGKNYVNWISKTGNYDAASNKIRWTIVLNEGGYGDIDGLELTDILSINGVEIPQNGVEIRITEKIPDERPYDAPVKLPYTFKKGTKATYWSGKIIEMDTTHEFVVTYETEVRNDGTGFFEHYSNTASIGEHSTPPSEVSIPKHEIDKQFTGSSLCADGGYKLSWQTFLDIPEGGLAENSYYEDTISDSSSAQVNNKNWFTKEFLEEITLKVGGHTILQENYTVLCDGKKADGTTFTGIELSATNGDDRISGFRIVFNKDIQRIDGNTQVKIAYSSYSSSTDLTYNTGTYTDGGFSVSDKATGKGNDGKLVRKSNSDGSGSFHKELEAIKDEKTGEYLLKYKLLINESNSANGTITITDTLGEGMSLCNEKWLLRQVWDNTVGAHVWVDQDSEVQLGGVYIMYRPYNENNSYPYSDEREEHTRNDYFIDSNKNVTGQKAQAYGVTVSYDTASRKITVTVPKEAYKETVNGQSINHAMVLYYAVKIDASAMTAYEYGYKNDVTVSTTTGQTDHAELTDYVIGDCVGKRGAFNNVNKTAHYCIDVNPKGSRLFEGEETTLTVKDTFKYGSMNGNNYYIDDVNILPGSIKLYKCSYDAQNNVKRELCTDIISQKLEKNNHEAYLTVEVPDGQFYQLEYDYILEYSDWAIRKMNSEDGLASFDLTNDVSIQGAGSKGTSSSDTITIEEKGSSATASKGYANITLYKKNKANEIEMLPGAEFTLERYNGVTWVPVVNRGEKFITGADGSVKLGEKLSDETYRIAYNFAYRLKETKAPKGYKINADYMYFCVKDNQSAVVVPDGWETASEYQDHMLSAVNNQYLFVSDEKLEEGKTEFEIRKIWKNPNGTIVEVPKDVEGKEISSIEVEICATREGSSGPWSVGSMKLTKENNWCAVKKDLDVYDYNTHELISYYAVEKNVPEGWAVSYSNNLVPIPGNADDRLLEVTNTITEGTIPVEVNKKWLKYDGTEYSSAPEKQVEVKLHRSSKIQWENEDSGNENVTVTVQITDKDHSAAPETRTIPVPRGSEIELSLESPGFNHLENVTSFSSDVNAVYDWTGKNNGTQEKEEWVSCESMKFYAMKDLTVSIGTVWAQYSLDTLTLKQTGNNVTAGTDVQDSSFEETVVLSASNNWSYVWAALPQISPYGTEYTYSVEEVVPTGYTPSVDQGENKITLTNKRGEGLDTSITVSKEWFFTDGTKISADDPAAAFLPDVEVELYRSTEQKADGLPEGSELVETVTVSASANWSYTWDYLDKYVSNDKTKEKYYYYVVEKESGYTVQYEGNGVQQTSKESPVKIKNTIPNTTIKVVKKWLDIAGQEKTEGIPQSAKIQLYKKNPDKNGQDIAYGNLLVLGKGQSSEGYSDEGWSYTWKNLPEGEYYVKEVEKEGFITSYQSGDSQEQTANAQEAAVSEGMITVTNKEVPVEISVTKEWAGVEKLPVQMQLCRSTSRPEKEVKTIRIYKANGPDGERTLLTAKKTAQKDFNVSVFAYYWGNNRPPKLVCISDPYVNVSDGVASETEPNRYTFNVNNVKNDCDLVLYTDGNPEIPQITGALEQTVPDAGFILPENAEIIKEDQVADALITLSDAQDGKPGFSNGGWAYTWKNLPRVNQDGEIYYYYVKEISTDGSTYVAGYSYTYNEDGSIASVKVVNGNSQTTSISAKKLWKDVLGADKKLSNWTVTLQLYQEKADGTWEKYPFDGEKVITQDTQEATVTWENLPLGKYYVEEVSMGGTSAAKENYTVSYQDASGELSEDPKSAAALNGEITIVNTEKPTELSIIKKWSDGTQYHKGESVIMKLYSSTTDPETAELEYKATQGNKVTVVYPNLASEYNPYLAYGVVAGDSADIRIYHHEYLMNQINVEEFSITDSSGQVYKPIIEDGKCLLFKNIPISKETKLTFCVNTSNDNYNIPRPLTWQSNKVTDASENVPEFSTLILPNQKTPVSIEQGGELILSNENNWRGVWDNLPTTDAEGNKLYYYVEEKPVANCETTYEYQYGTGGGISKISVTNRPTSGDVDISVDKLWKHPDGAVYQPEDGRTVTVQLYARTATGGWAAYKDADNQNVTAVLGDPVTEDGQITGYNWHHTFSNLPNGEYCVKEISMEGVVAGDYTVTYQTNTQKETVTDETLAFSGGGNITITNTETPTEVTVTKAWNGGTGSSARVQLYSSTTKPDVQSNTTGEKSFVVKVFDSAAWKEYENNNITSSRVRIIVKYISDSQYQRPSDSQGILVKCDNASVTCEKMTGDEKLDSIEIGTKSYFCVIFEASDITEDCKFTLEGNTYSYNTEVIIEPIEDTPENPKGEWVSIPIAFPANPENLTPVGKVVELAQVDNWTYTWNNLPKNDPITKKPLYYYVKELNCPGFTTTYEHLYREDDTVQEVKVTNTYNPDSREIQVLKAWPNDQPDTVKDYRVTVELWKKNSSTEQETKVSGVDLIPDLTLTASGEESWSGGWTNLPALAGDEVYFVKEVSVQNANGQAIEGYVALYEGNEITSSGTVRISNYRKTSVSVSKKWLNADGSDKTSGYPESITVHLYQEQPDLSYKVYETITLGAAHKDQTDQGYSDGGWTYTWDVLPEGTYYVGEDTVDRYTTTYQKEGSESASNYPITEAVESGNIVIRNQEEKIGLAVEKLWKDSAGNDLTGAELPAVTLNLYRSMTAPGENADSDTGKIALPGDAGDAIETITLNGQTPNGWSYRWTNLPKYNDSGQPYYYYVEENAVDGYTAGYEYTYKTSDDSSGGFEKVTITNQKKKQGIILPGTGSKYSFVFYGLGLAFLLISLIWMLLTFKKRNIQVDAGKGGRRSN